MNNKYNKPTGGNVANKKMGTRVAGIAALFLVSLFVIMPDRINAGVDWVNAKANLGLPKLPESGFNLGLDLQGGAHLIYNADTKDIAENERAEAVEGVRDVIERRVRGGLGVAEPLVQTTRVGKDYRIIVELPGIKDISQAIKMIGETPVLEFKEENNEPPRELTKEEEKQLKEFNDTAKKKATDALNAVKKGQDFGKVASEFSEDERTKSQNGNMGYIAEAQYPEIYQWAKAVKNGEISKNLVDSSEGHNVLKRLSQKDGDTYVSAAHILICYKGAERCDSQYSKEDARNLINEVKQKLTTENFAEMVRQYSTEPGAKDREGDLGKFKRGQMVEEFEKVVFDMPVNSISDVVETSFGYHLIHKTGEEVVPEYEVARILLRTKDKTDIVPPAEEWKSTGLSGKQLEKAEVTQDPRTGQVQVSLNFDSEGTQLFAELTEKNVGKPVAIFLDGQPISIPVVNEAILSGSAVISGNFNLNDARILAQRLNSGALPVPVELISQETVGATLGADSLNRSFKAGLIGLVAVFAFMILYYRLPGLLAGVALVMYALINLMIFKLLGVTMTLSGIAGIILSVGMAVDANVLVFERLKEELREGKDLKRASEEAFMRAWASIFDGNVTVLISCIFLIWMGSGFVQGFAVTLAIGILVSMFTAVTITRTLARWVFGWFKPEGNWLFLGHLGKKDPSTVKPLNLPIIKYSKFWIALNATVAIICLIFVGLWGLKPGIDFTGGSLMELSFSKSRPALETVREVFGELELKNVQVQNAGDKNLLARMEFLDENKHQEVLKALREKLGKDGGEVREERFETIGASVSSQLRQRSTYAVVFVSIGIMVYIAYAFRKVSHPVASWKYGILAIVSLTYNLLIMIGAFALFGRFFGIEVDTAFVVALLTVLGYSVNDTIVVFDRVRENLIRHGRDEFGTIVNSGLNQTLMRSINITLNTLFPLIALYFWGGATIHYFVLALLIGLAVGAYTSIFVASPLLALIEKWQKKTA